MQTHTLQRPKSNRLSRRVGRGGKRGTYSGRGMKGQKARAGANIRPAFRDVLKSVPKLRGVQRTRGRARSRPMVSVALGRIESAYSAQETVSPKTLAQKRIIRPIKGRLPRVKILASGMFSKSLQFEGCIASEAAQKQIDDAKGTMNIGGQSL